MQDGTGAGVIFGVTGGVMEAALRTAYYLLKSENPPEDAFKAVRSTGFNENEGIQEADFQIDNVTVRTAAVSGWVMHGHFWTVSTKEKYIMTL